MDKVINQYIKQQINEKNSIYSEFKTISTENGQRLANTIISGDTYGIELYLRVKNF